MRMIKGALEWIKRLENPICHDANTSVFANPRETSSIPFPNYPRWCHILFISHHSGQRRLADPSTLPPPHDAFCRVYIGSLSRFVIRNLTTIITIKRSKCSNIDEH